jgi:hypothetical protein
LSNERITLSFKSSILQKLKTSALCLLLVIVSSCAKTPTEEEAESLAETILNCDVLVNSATATTELCINRTAGHYIYNVQYGGRFDAPSAVVNAGNGVSSTAIPTGWYAAGGTVNFTDSSIAAGAIKDTINLFGAVGTLVTAAEAACILTSGGGVRSVDCSAARDNFFYTLAFGGRALDCTNVGQATTNTQPCYVNTTGVKITSTLPEDTGTTPECAVAGLQGANCRGPASTYRYTSEYGGRALLCSLGLNVQACWLEQTGYIVSTSDGSNACTDNGLNSLSCDTQPGRYVYPDEFGGRAANCTNDTAGSCFVTASTKQILEPALLPDKIRSNVAIFGIVGTFSGNGDWGSGAHRNIDTLQIGSAAEGGQYAANGSLPNLPAGYRTIPKIAIDDDGNDTSNLNLEIVDRTGWGTTSCGITQTTIIGRISDCSSIFGANARWNGAVSGNAGQGIWNLVSRSGAKSGSKGREVWRDERTGLLWSSVIGTAANWCRASGSSNATNVSASIKEADVSSICDNGTYQNQTTAISGCFEGTGFTTTDGSIDNLGKTGMNLAGSGTAPQVAWRLPTLYDYEIADANGMRFVLPDIGANGNLDEWTATLSSAIRSRAWIYNGAQGVHSTKARTLTSAFRCVGR